MSQILEVRKSYKYRLYASKRDFRLHDSINIAGIIWNHVTALRRHYYRLLQQHIPENRLKKHIAKLRMTRPKYAYWRKLGSQTVQEICERHETAYQRFFKKQGGLPQFKKVKKFRSFVLKQAGWKLHEPNPQKRYRKISIGTTVCKFVYHRPTQGAIKTVTVKRDRLGRLWFCFSVLEKMLIPSPSSTGKIGGFDFGLKTFLVKDCGQERAMPEFYKADLPQMRTIQRQVSKKQKGSKTKLRGSDI